MIAGCFSHTGAIAEPTMTFRMSPRLRAPVRLSARPVARLDRAVTAKPAPSLLRGFKLDHSAPPGGHSCRSGNHVYRNRKRCGARTSTLKKLASASRNRPLAEGRRTFHRPFRSTCLFDHPAWSCVRGIPHFASLRVGQFRSPELRPMCSTGPLANKARTSLYGIAPLSRSISA
jgi:hypothetical protein